MSKPPEIPPSVTLCLPAEYQQQATIESHDDFSAEPYWNAQRIAGSASYQYHVYLWAASLIGRSSCSSVLDIGCGPGIKLATMIQPLCTDVVGVDLENAVQIAKGIHGNTEFLFADLDEPDSLGSRKFDLILCADVIEHLADPRILIQSILSVSHPRTQILISTPDRHRLRGRHAMSSPMKEHIREWSALELNNFLVQEGLNVLKSRLLPFADGNLSLSLIQDFAFRLHITKRSPLRCYSVLCSPADPSSK